jgi:DNA-binding SARP family transcriptional activator
VSLIGYLAVHATIPQTRQRIAALFWPDSADEQALTNLRRELHHLRGVLGEEPSLVVTGRDLCWQDSPSCRVDVRVLVGEHDAAVAAAAAGDDAGVLGHASSSRARTTTGRSTPGPSSNSGAWTGSTCSPGPGRAPVTSPGRSRTAVAGPSCGRSTRPGTAG